MQSISVRSRGWFNEALHRKTSILGGMLAIASLSLAHYAGFLLHIPVQIVAVAGTPLAQGVTTTFLFYVFLCGIIARVLVSVLQLVVLPFLAVQDLLSYGTYKKLDWSRRRRFVRSHTHTVRWEGYLWVMAQVVLFIFLMLAIYVKFTVTWFTGVGLVTSIALILLSGLFRSGFFLQPRFAPFVYKIKTRAKNSGRVASAAFVTTTAALVVVAFFMGNMRMKLLREQNPQMTITAEFEGMAKVVASASGALLLFQQEGPAMRYIFASPEFTTSVETSESHFPPIGTKRKTSQ